MPWPFRRRTSEAVTAAPAAVAVAPAPPAVAAPEPPRYARAAPGAWKKLPLLPTVIAPPPRTAATEIFSASLATRQQVVHVSSVPRRSADAPAGAMLGLPFPLLARRHQREMPPAGSAAADVPGVVRRASATTAARPSFGIDELPPLPPVKLVPLPPPRDQAYEFDLDELGPDGVLDSWSIERDAPEEVRERLGLVEVAAPEPPPAPPRPQRRPNLGQSRRLGLGNPVAVPEDYLQALRSGHHVPMPPETFPEDVESEIVEEVPEDLRRMVMDAHGVDVSDVPIVRSPEVSDEARSLGARAFARDDAVFLPKEAGSLDLPEARALTAHELVHIAQQRQLGTAVPDETSNAGLDLESDARLAEAHVHGRAPRPGSPEAEALRVVQPLLTGVARLDTDGNLVYTPGPRTPVAVQRADVGVKPEFNWQGTALREKRVLQNEDRKFYDRVAELIKGDYELASRDEQDVIRQDNERRSAELEEQYKPTLVEYRMEKRLGLIKDNEGKLVARERKQAITSAKKSLPDVGAEPTDEEITEAEDAFKQAREALAELKKAYESDYAHWKVVADAIDQVETKYPMRDVRADLVQFPDEPQVDMEHYDSVRAQAIEAGSKLYALKHAQGSKETPTLTQRTGKTGSGSEGEETADKLAADHDKVVDEMAKKVQEQIGPIDEFLKKKNDDKSKASPVAAALERAAKTADPNWQRALALEKLGEKSEDVTLMTPDERKVWEAKNITVLHAERKRVFDEATDTAIDVVGRQLLIREGKDIRALSKVEQMSYLSADDWEAVFKQVTSKVPLLDEKLDPLVDMIDPDALVLRRQMERGEGEDVVAPAPPQVLPRAETQPQAPPAAPAESARSASTTPVAHTPLNLDEVEHDQLDLLARRLWFFMRSRLRNELLVDRERSGTLSDFVR